MLLLAVSAAGCSVIFDQLDVSSATALAFLRRPASLNSRSVLMGLIFSSSAAAATLPLLVALLARSLSAARVAVVGGSGRVGGSAVYHLHKRAAIQGGDMAIHVVGRSEASYKSFRRRYGDRISSSSSAAGCSVTFDQLDVTSDGAALDDYIKSKGFNLVINTAGPFQGLDDNQLLQSCLRCGVDYLDVCDDISLSRRCRAEPYQQLARATGATAIISAGIWPGVSSLLAKSLVARLSASGSSVDDVVFSFFTAGSGGAGLTILTATFLLLGERVLRYRDGCAQYSDPGSDVLTKDFGPEIGLKEVANLNLIECESCFASNNGQVPNVSTYFGTDPPFWNSLFRAMCAVIPRSALQSRQLMERLALVSLPVVRIVDFFVGSKNGIRIDVTSGSIVRRALLTHRDLEAAVGLSLSLFAEQLLLRDPTGTGGVFFPEEVEAKGFAESIIEGVSLRDDNCITFEVL